MQVAKVNNTSIDGVSLIPLLMNRKIADRNYYLHFPHYSPQHGKPGAVIRKGSYKLIEWYEDGKLELYDLEKDISEANNIASSNVKMVATMKAALDQWRKQVGAKMPQLNPSYVEE